MAALIASQTTAADSAEFALAAGAETHLYLKDESANTRLPYGATVEIQLKSGDAVGPPIIPFTFKTIATLTSGTPNRVIRGAGIYRVRKPASTDAFGVDRD